MRPFLLALADQIGVYRRQEDSRSRSSQQADKAKKELATAKAELQEEHSSQELLSQIVLEAQARLAGVQTRDQLYQAAQELLKKRFKVGTLAFLGRKEDSKEFSLLYGQALKRKGGEQFGLAIDDGQLRQLEKEDSGIHFGNRKGKEGGSAAAKALKGLGLQSLYHLVSTKQETVLLGLGNSGGSFSKEETFALGALTRLLSLVIMNLSHLEKIEELSYTDSMTGLYNYRYFYKRLKEEILRAQRFSRQLGLVIFDIDDFKVFNDNYGHQVGDQLLRQLGRLLTASVRSVDVVSRYGGEEFCIIMPETGPDDCRTFMERLRNKILENRFRSKYSNDLHKITVSLGGAIYPNDAQRVDRLIYCADMALLKAKASGRNKSCMYEKNLTEDKQVS